MTTAAREDTACGRDGFIIVAVLWILIALATLASVFSIYLANSAVAIAVKDDAVQNELLVSSSLEFVAYQLLAPNENQNQNQNQSQNQNQNPESKSEIRAKIKITSRHAERSASAPAKPPWR